MGAALGGQIKKNPEGFGRQSPWLFAIARASRSRGPQLARSFRRSGGSKWPGRGSGCNRRRSLGRMSDFLQKNPPSPRSARRTRDNPADSFAPVPSCDCERVRQQIKGKPNPSPGPRRVGRGERGRRIPIRVRSRSSVARPGGSRGRSLRRGRCRCRRQESRSPARSGR